MAITATSITPENTLEEFRIQFNNLVVDVDGVAAGNTFTQSIIFEGETADESETTLLATDPTADRTITLPDATGTVITTGNSDAATTTTSVSDVDFVLVDDGGTLKKITRSNLGIGSTAADDISTGDAAVTIATSTGNITIDAQGSDTDIIFKGTDDASDITALTLDMSDAGTAIFNHDIKIADGGFIGSASDADAIGISAGGDVSLTGGALSLIDNEKIILGTDSDISFTYDESTTDSLVISSDVNDAGLGIIFQADAGADGGDEWKMNFANGGTFTFGNDIASAGTHTTLLTITPNSTAANSTHAFIGSVSASGGLLVADAGTIGSASDSDAISISSGGVVAFSQDVSLVDDKKVILGSNSDISLQYDESTTDSLVVSSDVNDAALGIVFQADAGADAGDEWKMNFANGGTFTFGNDIASAGTHTTLLTITPNSTAASSTFAFVGSITAAGNAVKTVGKETIYVPASAMYPTTTNGCAALAQVEGTAGRPESKVLDFDPSSDENAQFTVAFPKSWNESTITFKAFFTVTGTDTGTVSWALSGVATADNDAIDVAFGTAVAPTAKAHSGTSGDINVTAESGNVTIAGSPSTDEMVFFNIMRDVSADNQTGDARLLGIQIFFTTDAANDS
tara:strand:+ start:2114 stop:4003 length:1890 start_codon:yes stop_codon:yes gene_type:complete